MLLVDQLLPRNQWCTGRITETFPDAKGSVRTAKIKVSKFKDGTTTKYGIKEFIRPVSIK